MVYNRPMVDYYILARKNKDGRYTFHAAFPEVEYVKGKKCVRYKAMRSTGVEARKAKDWTPKQKRWTEASKAAARRVADAIAAEGKVLAPDNDIEAFLTSFWTPGKSEYLNSKVSEGDAISPRYCESNRTKLEKYFLPWCKDNGITKLVDLNRRNITRWRDWLRMNNDDGGISRSTQNKVRQALFVALQWAEHMDLIPEHPGLGVKRVKEDPKERPIFQIDELGRLFDKPWDDIRAYTACLLAAETGMRLGEVRGLLYRNLHLDEGYLDVLTNWIDGEGLKPPKWGSTRSGVPVSPRCAIAIRQMMQVNRWEPTDDGFVFSHIEYQDRPIATAAINRALKRAMKAAGIPPGRTFQSFRHSLASHWNGPLNAIQQVLGHSAIEMTQHYSDHATDEGRESFRRYQQNIIPFAKAE